MGRQSREITVSRRCQMEGEPIAADTTGVDGPVAMTPAGASERPLTPAERNQRQLAAVKHGLYVSSPAGRRVRHYRAGRLLRRLQQIRPWMEEAHLPIARAWCELEVLAHDVYTRLQQVGVLAENGQDPHKLLAEYRAIRRDQLPYSAALGLTPMSQAQLSKDLASESRAAMVEAAQ